MICDSSGQCVQALHNFVCTCTDGAGLSDYSELACTTLKAVAHCGGFCTSNGFVLDIARSSYDSAPC